MIQMSQEDAFRRFTLEVSQWWPMTGRPLGVSRPGTVVFEERAGGQVFHRKRNGDTQVWGTIEKWNPPRNVRFSFHPERPPSQAQTVDVTFEPAGQDTLVQLTHSGWESLGSGGAALRDEFDTGWEPVMGRFSSSG